MQDLFKEIIVRNTNNFIWNNQQLRIKSFHDLKEEHKKDIFRRSITQFCKEKDFDVILLNKPLIFEYGKIYYLSKTEITAILYLNIKKELVTQITKRTDTKLLFPFIMFISGLIVGMSILFLF